MSLATKYRPKTFDEVVGQTSVIKILQRQILTDNIKNSYLFMGASGSGKTTSARAFAYAINETDKGIIEIDAASNSGVDNVRTIIKDAEERSISSKYKIFIVDECHSLSNQAWQAFLKTIEEPPKYTIFIFCTTDPQKIPNTILNRVQQFNFTKIPSELIVKRLAYICEQEGFTNYEESIEYISKVCKNQMRDAISLLEKVSDYDTTLNIDSTMEILGDVSYNVLFGLTHSLLTCNQLGMFNMCDQLYNKGTDIKLFTNQFISFIIDVLKYFLIGDLSVTNIPNFYEESVKYILGVLPSKEDNNKFYNYLLDKLLEVKVNLNNDSYPMNTLQAMLSQVILRK